MTGDMEAQVQAARARFRARWTHPPLDQRDVEERVALRLHDQPALEVRVLACEPACRVFVRAGEGWVSRYVHAVSEVDATLELLVQRARELQTKVVTARASGARCARARAPSEVPV